MAIGEFRSDSMSEDHVREILAPNKTTTISTCLDPFHLFGSIQYHLNSLQLTKEATLTGNYDAFLIETLRNSIRQELINGLLKNGHKYKWKLFILFNVINNNV